MRRIALFASMLLLVTSWLLPAAASGDVTIPCSTTPVAVAGISNATAIVTGQSSACALLADGTVKCWGRNLYGNLGNGTSADTNFLSPVAVSGLSGATGITMGPAHTCASLSDGTVKCWGINELAQLGTGSNAGPEACGSSCSTVPVPVDGITSATSVSAGNGHTCALLSDGGIKCWGQSHVGQIGNGTSTGPDFCPVGFGGSPCSLTPATVSGISSATDLAAGGGLHTCARLADETIQCWGFNDYAQLAIKPFQNGLHEPEACPEPHGNSCSTTPVPIGDISEAVSVSAGTYYTCAALADGTVRCWGMNNVGQLGTGSRNGPQRCSGFSGIPCATTPVLAKGISGATSVSTGHAHTCALLSNGTIACWGMNEAGQLGNGRFTEFAFSPVTVTGIDTATAVSVSLTSSNTCALLADGTVKCWGYNFNGQLGIAPASGPENCAPNSDLLVTALAASPAAVAPGRVLLATSTITNQGNGRTHSFDVSFHLSTDTTYGGPDDIAFTATRSMGGVSAEASKTTVTALTVPPATPPGSYYLCAMADSGDTEIELDEANNTHCTSSPIQVIPAELLVTAVEPDAATVKQGGKLSVTTTVENQAAVPVGTAKLAFRLSGNDVFGDGDDVVVTTVGVVTGLGAGSSRTATTKILIPFNAPPGAYSVCAMVDPANTTVESGEGNNTRCSTTQVTVPPPDLVVSALSTTATTVQAGQTVLVSNVVKNQGGAQAGPSLVAFGLSTNGVFGDGDDVASTTTRSVGALIAGVARSANTPVLVPMSTPAGLYYVCARSDGADSVAESDEANNARCTASPITVTP